MENLKEIKSQLADFFSLITRYIIEIYQISEGKKISNGKPGNYAYGQIIENTRKMNQSMFAYISFIEDLLNGIIKWFEFFSGLVNALGSKEYYRVLLREVKLEEVIDRSRIDMPFLKFQIKSVLSTSFQDLKSIYSSLLERAKSVRQSLAYLSSGSSERFIETVENQARGWLNIYDELYGSLQSIITEVDESICIKKLTMVASKSIDFFEKILEIRVFIKISEEARENFMAYGFMELFDRFNELKEDVIKFFEYITKVYEHAGKCFLQILTMLWGTEEEARHKLELFIKSEIQVTDLIPSKFSLKDLAFGLNLAVFEWEEARSASQIVDEKRRAIELIANYVATDEMQKLHTRLVKGFESRDKYRKEIYHRMLDMQNKIQKIMNS